VTDNLAALFLLDPEVVFLNHGSYGACPRPVFDTYRQWQMQLERQPVAFLEPALGMTDRMRTARVAVADLVGAAPDDLVGVMNATTGLNIVARALDLRPGDEILTTDHEYAALAKTWDFVCARTGAKVVQVTVPMPLTEADGFTAAIVGGMTARTRVLFLSHITSATALRFPIEAAVQIARARGIWSVIDGAHAPGQIALNLDALGADFYAGNGHKWLMGPKGTAFLHVRREMQPLIDPLVISHGWTAEAGDGPGPFGNSRFVDRLEMQGTRDPAGWLSLPAAIAFRQQHGWDKVAARCQALVQDTAARVAKMTGLAPLSSAAFCAPQMVSMPVSLCDMARLKADLMARYRIEIPCILWNGQALVRVSAQGYNTQADMDRLVTALTDLLPLPA
jgi:isopenicillin-N epimerase